MLMVLTLTNVAKLCEHILLILLAAPRGPGGARRGVAGAGPGPRRGPVTADPWGGCQFLAKFQQNVARFRLYRHQFLQVNMRFAAFFKIYQIIKLKFLKLGKVFQILRHLQNSC